MWVYLWLFIGILVASIHLNNGMNLKDGPSFEIETICMIKRLNFSTTLRCKFPLNTHTLLDWMYFFLQSFSQSCTVQIPVTWSTRPGLSPTLNSWWGQPFSIAVTLASFCRVAPPLHVMAASQGRQCGRLDYLTVFVSIRKTVTFQCKAWEVSCFYYPEKASS